MTNIIWQDIHHSELTVAQLYKLLQLRSDVFVIEQQAIYRDIDDLDLIGDNRHIMAWQADTLVAYARILIVDNSLLKIGRVIVCSQVRGQQLGYQLLQHALASCDRINPQATIKISAQAHLQKFYGAYGFVAEGELYDDTGIAHIDMLISRH